MVEQFKNDPPIFAPSPKSHLERRLIRADLDRRIAADKAKKAALVSVSDAERPAIGALPNFPVAARASEGSVDELPFIELDEPEEADPENEVTAGRVASVVIPREPPVRK